MDLLFSRNVVEDYVDSSVKQALQIHLTPSKGSFLALPFDCVQPPPLKRRAAQATLFLGRAQSSMPFVAVVLWVVLRS